MPAPKRSYRWAVEELAAAQKPGAGVPAYLRWVNRGLGRKAAALAYVLGITPNGVTLISAISSFAGITLVATGHALVPISVLAVLLLLIGYALDSADGQLARLLRAGSPAGEWLDHVVDAVRLPAFHFGVAIGIFRRDGGELWIVVMALLFALLSSTWFIGQLLAEKLGQGSSPGPGAQAADWVSFAKLPYDVATSFLSILLFPWIWLFTGFYGLLFFTTLLVAVVSLRRKYVWLARGVAQPEQVP